MKYLSLCSGIEAATVAWHPLGWEAVAYSEIERFPSEVLAHHYPNTPNLGDMTKFKEWTNVSNVDVLVGGTPCQSFSVAGLRKGLDDPRGNLMLTYLAIADQYKPKWIVWENVPGVLSSNGGKDFGVFLGALGELGYGFAYRVLDAQYFGVAQRRRRVFVVGYLGDWRRAAAVLFERDSLCGNPAPSREKREDPAKCLTRGAGQRYDFETEDLITQPVVVDRAAFNQGENAQYQFRAEHSETMDTLVAGGFHAVLQPIAYNITFCDANGTRSDRPNGGLYVSETDVSSTMTKAGIGTNVAQPIALAENTIGRKPENGGNGDGFTDGGPMYTLNATGVHGVAQPICLMDQGGSVMNVEHDMVGTLRRETHGHEPIVAQPIGIFQDSEYGIAQYDTAGTLRAGRIPAHQMAVAFSAGNSANARSIGYTEEGTPPLRASASGSNQVPTMAQGMAVRRLTPVECERLQGFPDSFTDIKSKGKATPDGPRYKALGNSMAVPVMAWIGKRINEVEQLCKPNK